jgi:hypothetical protein
MHLGQRCDEIVRLIDETLVAVVADAHGDDGQGADVDAPAGSAAVGAVLYRRRRRGGNVRL